jgi:hypothetical protein
MTCSNSDFKTTKTTKARARIIGGLEFAPGMNHAFVPKLRFGNGVFETPFHSAENSREAELRKAGVPKQSLGTRGSTMFGERGN